MALRFPGGDLVAPLRFPEVAVTGATTARPGVMHVCNGTAADYTVTLPPASSCAGKHMGFRMAPGLTKLVTLKGDGAELIDGVNTRIMWANEVAVLYCDGTAWTKVAGKTIPMMAKLSAPASQILSNGALTKLNVTRIDYANFEGMADSANKKLTVRRPGKYEIAAATQSVWGANGLLSCIVTVNGAWCAFNEQYGVKDCHVFPSLGFPRKCLNGDYFELHSQQWQGVDVSTYVDISGVFLGLKESPEW